jgi:hypothetical protein
MKKIIENILYGFKQSRIILFLRKFIICGKTLSQISKIHTELLREKIDIAKTRKLKVQFMIYHQTHWSCQSIHDELVENKHFDVCIIVVPSLGVKESLREKIMRDTLDFFISRGMKAEIRDRLDDDKPDILFYQMYWQLIPEQFRIKHWFDKALCISIPYGFMIANITHCQFDGNFHNLVWLNCEETELHLAMAKKYSRNRGRNALATGYPKMDLLFPPRPREQQKTYKIIYAPHYSIDKDWQINFATFHLYYRQMLELVKNSPQIDFVFKPHPLLESRVQEVGLMTEQEYENYLSDWAALPNGQVILDGNYMELFQSADAMLLDSLSFIAEWLYTGKPICFISKWNDFRQLTNQFNDFGQEAIKYLDIAYDWNGIEDFVKNAKASDIPGRQDFINNILRLNHGTSGKFIVDHIKKELKL